MKAAAAHAAALAACLHTPVLCAVGHERSIVGVRADRVEGRRGVSAGLRTVLNMRRRQARRGPSRSLRYRAKERSRTPLRTMRRRRKRRPRGGDRAASCVGSIGMSRRGTNRHTGRGEALVRVPSPALEQRSGASANVPRGHANPRPSLDAHKRPSVEAHSLRSCDPSRRVPPCGLLLTQRFERTASSQ